MQMYSLEYDNCNEGSGQKYTTSLFWGYSFNYWNNEFVLKRVYVSLFCLYYIHII